MPFQPEPETFYKIVDLEKAGIAGIPTIRKWIKSGRLKAALVGRDYMINGDDLRKFLLQGSGTRHSGIKKKVKVKAKK